MVELANGTLFYLAKNGEYDLYKVIHLGDEHSVFVRAYWSTDVVPTVENWKQFDIRTTCEAMQQSQLEQAVAFTYETVNSEDELALSEFLRIQQGIKSRTENLTSILEKADQLLENESFDLAIHAYTEAASYSKYTSTIFDKRGYCLLKVGRFSEAIADLEHSLTLVPNNTETALHCSMAYAAIGETEKAKELLEGRE